MNLFLPRTVQEPPQQQQQHRTLPPDQGLGNGATPLLPQMSAPSLQFPGSCLPLPDFVMPNTDLPAGPVLEGHRAAVNRAAGISQPVVGDQARHGSGGNSSNPPSNARANRADEDEDDDDDDTEEGSGAFDSSDMTCDASAFMHNVLPAEDLPFDWPVYEVYAINVAQEMLQSTGVGAAQNWGDFTSAPAARAAKRLLYLLCKAAERACVGPPCNPLEELWAVSDAPSARSRRERQIMERRLDENPQGNVARPIGIGGALPNTGRVQIDSLLTDLDSMLSGSPNGGRVTARDAQHAQSRSAADRNVFIFRKRVAEPMMQAPINQNILMRRISVHLEELISGNGAKTVGWRWWFYIHDPRIVFSQWIARIIQENATMQAEEDMRRDRQALSRSGRGGGGGNNGPGTTTASSSSTSSTAMTLNGRRALQGSRRSRNRGTVCVHPDTPDCYRAICSMEDYARNLQVYQRGAVQGFGDDTDSMFGTQYQPQSALKYSVPRRDPNAVAGGLIDARTSLHPARAFSPLLAMDLYVRGKVCEPQTTLLEYKNSCNNLLGAVPRHTRTTLYNPALLSPEQLHETMLPRSPFRTTIIRELALQCLTQQHASLDLPPQVREPLSRSNMTEAMMAISRLEPIRRQQLTEAVNGAIRESDLEQRELPRYLARRRFNAADHGSSTSRADVEPDLDADLMPPRQRRRLNPEDAPADCPGLEDARVDPEGADDEDDADDDDLTDQEGDLEAEEDEAFWSQLHYDPEASLDSMLFNMTRQMEEQGSSLSQIHVKRSPLLFLRMHFRAYRARIQELHEPNTPAYLFAVRQFMERAFAVFWSFLDTFQDDQTRLSAPVRGGYKFLRDLTRKPNYIVRHHEAIEKQHRAALQAEERENRANPSRAGRRQERESTNLLVNMLLNRTHSSAGGIAGPGRGRQRRLNRHSEIEQQLHEFRPKPGGTIWHEWPYGGGWNLTAYGSWRALMRHRTVQHFRCRPGKAPDVLHRLLLSQGVATTYNWKLKADNLICGQPGVGKSYLVLCIDKQSYPGQVLMVDHLTPKWATADTDVNDVLVIIEEGDASLIGQDEKGNVIGGNNLQKVIMSRHCVNTIMPHITEDGKRIRVHSTARCMVGFMVVMNPIPKPYPNGQWPAILRRYMMDYLSDGNHDVPLADINNAMSVEMDTPEAARFFHELALTNCLIMMVEKLIEAGVLEDVDTNICAFHFPWYFEQVHRRCRVPKVSGSQREQYTHLCRQTCIRFAIHRMFFSETSAANIRCELREGCDGTKPSHWVPKKFDPMLLLDLQPLLVVTEEMMADVLTTVRSTYMPTTVWGVLEVLSDMRKATGIDVYRKITRRRMLQRQRQALNRQDSSESSLGTDSVPGQDPGGDADDDVDDEDMEPRTADGLPLFTEVPPPNNRRRSEDSDGDVSMEPYSPDLQTPMSSPVSSPQRFVEDELELDGSDVDMPDAATGLLAPSQPQEEEEEENDDFDCIEGANDGVSGPRQQSEAAGNAGQHSNAQIFDHDLAFADDEDDSELDRLADDENYLAFVYQDFHTACDYFAQESGGRIDSGAFKQVLRQLEKKLFVHWDRNRPKISVDGRPVKDSRGKQVYLAKLKSRVVLWEEVPQHMNRFTSNVVTGGQRNPVQICILIEYLEQERNDSLNEILREGLSYAGARRRQIISACGVSTLHVTDPVPPEAGGESQPRGILRELLGVIPIEPKRQNVLRRVNHFLEDDITDSLVFNRGLNRDGTGPRGWGKADQDQSRQPRLALRQDLDKVIITEYWHRVGCPIKEENYPWNYTKKLQEMVLAGKDETGTPLSTNIKAHYPNSYLPISPEQEQAVNVGRRQARAQAAASSGGPDERRRLELEAELTALESMVYPASRRFHVPLPPPPPESRPDPRHQPPDSESGQQDGEEAADSSAEPVEGDFSRWLRQQRKRKRGA